MNGVIADRASISPSYSEVMMDVEVKMNSDSVLIMGQGSKEGP